MNGMDKNRVNGWLYSFWAKALVILLAFCMAGMACFGGYLIARNLEVLTVEEAFHGVDYGNSHEAYNRVLVSALNVIENKVCQSDYLKDGVFDGEDTVDILNPEVQSDKKKKDVTTYKLKDLLALHDSGNLESISGYVSNVEDADEFYYEGDLVANLEDNYGIETFFRDKKNHLYGVTGEIRGVNNTRDVVQYEIDEWEDELLETEMAQYQGASEYLYVINPDGSARSFVFGVDQDVALIYTSRAEMMARLMDTSELDEKEDISQFYGVYGERFCFLYNNCRSLECVKPLSGKSIAVYALMHPYDFSILDAYSALIEVSDQVYTAYLGAAKVVHCDHMDRSTVAEETDIPEEIKNLDTMYYYQDLATKKVYTNMAAWEDLQDVDVYNIVKEYENDYPAFPYIYYRVDEDDSFGTLNIPEGISNEAETEVYSLLENHLQGKDNYAMIILHNPVKEMYAETDLFPERSEMAGDAYANELRRGVVFCGAGSVLFLILLILAMIQVANPGGEMRYTEEGKRNRQATAFTKNIPICLLLFLMLMVWGLWGGALGFVLDFFHDLREMQPHFFTILFSFGVTGAGIALWTILTLLAKIKTRTFFKNSLVGWFFGLIKRGIKAVYYNRKATGRVALVYGAVTLLAVLGFGFAMDGEIVEVGVLILFVDWLVLGAYLVKKSIQRQALKESIAEIAGGNLDYQIQLDKLSGDEKEMADNLNNLKGGMQNAINEQMKSERMKTDLITNVSHDIKTPLTSIINYVDLLKREDIQDEKIAGYIEILDNKSARLKQLTEDLVEASKISSGNIVLDCVNLDLGQLIQQVNGEFLERFENRNLELVCNLPAESMIVYADGRRISRVFENLYNNVAKYAMPGTRVYVTGALDRDQVILSIKNISEQPLNVSADELMERFVRGDVSRSTEGSGLGLEIARNLTLIQNGQFDLFVDGDLFRVTTSWKRSEVR